MPSLIPVTSARLGDHLPLLELLPDNAPLTWVRGGDGLVGWGNYASTVVKGANRFADARTWWHQQLEKFAIADSVHASGTGPILFTSFSFDPDEDSVLVIPQIVVGMRNGSSWITWIGDQAQPKLLEEVPPLEDAEFNWGDGSLSPSEWQLRVAQAIKEIEDTKLEKVVLARDLKINSHRAIDPRKILRNLSAEYPSTWIFAVDGLVGATPELLLRLSRGMVTSRVLAGTISKTGDDDKDLALAASLARSSKDLEEHEYAVRSVAEALDPFCTSTNVLDKLHPSAAVCGTPTNVAADLIKRIEGMSRGRYAGPVGWLDARGDGELGIALRCGQITENEIQIYAGCGIVAGSNPEKELTESSAKFAPMRSALQS
jgi:menaquinone-specific isochorismate synthase